MYYKQTVVNGMQLVRGAIFAPAFIFLCGPLLTSDHGIYDLGGRKLGVLLHGLKKVDT